MIWVDYFLLAVLLLSVLIGILRGLVREALGVGTWVGAFVLAWLFGRMAGEALSSTIANPNLRLAIGYALVFIVTLLIGAIITYVVGEAVRNAGLGSTDRTLGGGLGLIRGVIILAAFILCARTMGAAQDPWWQESMLVKRFEWLADGLEAVVPASWLEPLKPAPTSTSPPSSQ